MLVFDNELHELHTTRRWRDLARMPRADFEAQVEAFLKPGGAFGAAGDGGQGLTNRLILVALRLG